MIKYMVTAILACASTFVFANHAAIEGNYACKGVQMDGKTPFTCNETIKKTGNTYALTATCSDGTSYSGTGIYQSQNHSLSLAFKNDKQADEIGVSVKKIDKKGNLIGQWTNLVNRLLVRLFALNKRLHKKM
ncbi:hypothetical protein [Legionella hackeliae]|uniref:Uncharacterized protein n=1 Tax=Legionella hackeliae TaxID=449 RepID=A0A0A8UXX3_LEGHA|nr:hypothetical protein [Legionella hackeliae]KTD13107.1 hypothetical protein Lhac_0976 [Legionella hackeliae]CEK11584.1 exported protein of unknown function [Legionella hackeliae]STX48356.1 Uncharacterised protein [Legionella hackeliae]